MLIRSGSVVPPQSGNMTLTGTLAGATVGAQYSSDLVLGGTFVAPVTISAESGTIPSWLTVAINGTDVNFSGIAPNAQVYAFTPQATDSSGTPQVAVGSPQRINVAKGNPAGSPPPANGIPAYDGTTIPYPLTNSGAGTAAIEVTLSDASVWAASASVTGNCQSARQSIFLTSGGITHQYLIADFYGDGVVLCNDLMDAVSNYQLSFKVTFNGATIYQSVTMTLYQRCAFWPIRWSYCPYIAPNLAKCPNWDNTQTPNILDWTTLTATLGVNLMGPATRPNQNNPGGGMEIGNVPGVDCSFALLPNANSWIITRLMSDAGGVFQYRVRDRATLDPILASDYPNASVYYSTLPGNPITSNNSGSPNGTYPPYQPSPEHITRYGAIAYLASGSAYDRDMLVSTANYGLLAMDPRQRGSTGDQGIMLIGSDPRQKAWTISGFLWAAGILPSSDKFQQYYSQVCTNNAAAFAMAYLGDTSVFPNGITYPVQASGPSFTITPNQMANPMNVFSDRGSFEHAGLNGTLGYSPWEDHYACGVFDWAVEKLGMTNWTTVRNWKAAFIMQLFNNACPVFASAYVVSVGPTAGAYTPPGDFYTNYASGFAAAWPGAVGLACGSSAMLTWIQANQTYLQTVPTKAGDMVGTPGSNSGYPANLRQAVVAAVNAGLTGASAAWTFINSVPTPIAWNGGLNGDIVP